MTKTSTLAGFVAVAVTGIMVAASAFAAQPAITPVDVNNASVAELKALPGVGDVIAQRIVDYRTANGPFKQPDDLLPVKGIGPKKLAKMTPYLKFGSVKKNKKVHRLSR